MALASKNTITIFQGEFEVSDDPEICLVTILGSCVATCLYDPQRGIGGVNHFLLPGGGKGQDNNLRYGVHSMELLINALLRGGAEKRNLCAKVFGGARMLDEFSDIGKSNADFAQEFLDTESIPCVSKSLQGNRHQVSARRIRFWPVTGRVQQYLVR